MKKGFALFLFLIACHISHSQGIVEYTNPVLAGFYPDPSICKSGNDYYLVNSSFAYFPGLPIFHSADLVNWRQIGNAMDRPEQLNLDGAGVSRGLYAPAIRYHKGLFYITCTLVDKGGNFVITAKNPAGPWTNPVWLPAVNGIDPSLFFDDNDKAWIIYNSIPPDNQSQYQGHRTIRMQEFDPIALKVTGEEKILINGGTDISKKPVWIEGPHIFKKDNFYYLVCAEGGTGDQHSEVVFRSEKADGPYISYQNNPILTQRTLDKNRVNPITSTGHADFVTTNDGKWYAVFLGCRPYENDYYNTGRETFMAPVTWKDGWPTILHENEEVQYHYPVPMPGLTRKVSNPNSGKILFHDDFNATQLDYSWVFLRTPHEKWYTLTGKKGFLSMELKTATCAGKSNPSFIAHRQQNIRCTASASIDFKPANEKEKAGLVAFQNEQHFYFLAIGFIPGGNSRYVLLYKSTKDSAAMDLIASQALPENYYGNVRLKISASEKSYSFYYAQASGDWKPVIGSMDPKFLSTKEAGGFVGTLFALYATSSGIISNNKAYFDWFDYVGGR